MIPKKGGDPVPEPPIVLGRLEPGGDGACTDIAKKYCAELHAYMFSEDPHKGMLNLSRAQKVELKNRYARWQLRAQGKDGQYLRTGTFPRHPESRALPTWNDKYVEELRRKNRAAYEKHKQIDKMQKELKDFPKTWTKKLQAAEKARQEAAGKPPVKEKGKSKMQQAADEIKKQELKGDKDYE